MNNKYNINFCYYPGKSEEVIVFIHGIPTNHHLWDLILPYVKGHYSVLTVDLIGYGNSDRAPYYDLTLPKQAEYIINLLDHLGISKAHFVGHDLGGGIVQILAVSYADRVESIVIADGVCFANWPLPKVVSIRYPTAEEFQPTPLFIERMLREGLYYQQLLKPNLLYDFLRPFSGPNGPQDLKQASFALNHHQTEDLVPFLPKVKVPATLLWGQYDRYLPPYWGKLLHHHLPYSSFKIISDAGHYSMIDNPNRFAEELIHHMESIT
ncbi:Pimeloyl-ACP methyl ester carboxylesterase [Gracilibacillus ureilyticus]|uniref:Pimeloyl-ACP methyl ester carboxylesterase n=1 Tax=Gracilibacillus ureilyticus TaxID=531814 RepID=A0A1H9PCB5_9BACI|nr:alpha/beta hydrolase [Gracilibacillus ureilyticus]SER45449.1 Pimeloyl-ACP methyl ester carboxylesterase [Gracilibacillus ureilyticus]